MCHQVQWSARHPRARASQDSCQPRFVVASLDQLQSVRTAWRLLLAYTASATRTLCEIPWAVEESQRDRCCVNMIRQCVACVCVEYNARLAWIANEDVDLPHDRAAAGIKSDEIRLCAVKCSREGQFLTNKARCQTADTRCGKKRHHRHRK